MFLCWYLHLILLFALHEVVVVDGGDEGPTWPAGCTTTLHENTRWDDIEFTILKFNGIKEKECKDKCDARIRCGSYVSEVGGGECYLYQMTPLVLADWTDTTEKSWKRSDNTYNMGIKDCDVDLPESSCTSSYDITHERKRLTDPYTIVTIGSGRRKMIFWECERYCDVWWRCESFTYTIQNRTDGIFYDCYLNNIKIPQLIDRGIEEDIVDNTDIAQYPIYKTYDKLCGSATTVTSVTLATVVIIITCINLLLTGSGAVCYLIC